jgi:hypothetical protein
MLYSTFKLDKDQEETLKQNGVTIPTYNLFEDEASIVFQQSERISDDLIPIIEFKIIVNKECLHRHQMEWKPVFKSHYDELSTLENYGERLLQFYIGSALNNEFGKFLNSLIKKA